MNCLRNTNIERLRIIASFGIICFHSQLGLLKLVGYAGLPIFVMLTFYLGTIKQTQSINKSNSSLFKDYLLSKTNRLIIPYFFWVIIYWCWGCLRALLSHGDIINVPITAFFPLYGTSIHLWYIPFIFIGLTAVSFAKIYFSIKGFFSFLLYLILSFLTGILSLCFNGINQFPIPIPQFFFGLPALFIGLTISDTNNLNKPLIYSLTLIITALTGGVRLLCDRNDLYLFLYPLSSWLVIIAINIPGKPDKITAFFSPLTFGIYLIHPIIISIVNIISSKPNDQSIMPFREIVVFVISALSIFLLKKTKMNKYI